MESLAQKTANIRQKMENLSAIRSQIPQLVDEITELEAKHREAQAQAMFNGTKAPAAPKELSAARTRLNELETALPAAERMLSTLAESVKQDGLTVFAGTEAELLAKYEAAQEKANEAILAAMALKADVDSNEGAALDTFKTKARELLRASTAAEILDALEPLLPVESVA